MISEGLVPIFLVQLNSHFTQAITLTVARAATIESWSNVVELAGSISRRAARRRGLLVLSSVMGWECSVSDKRNPAIVEVNLNGAPQFTIPDFFIGIGFLDFISSFVIFA